MKPKYLRYIMLLFALTAPILRSLAAEAVYASQSMLSSGNWVKIKVTETGIHELSASQLSSWGFNDISKVKVFGYGGAMISEKMGDGYIDDLPQVPCLRTGNRLLFYAQSNISWKSQSGNVRYVQTQNPYSTAGYYFLTDRDDIETAEIATTGIATDEGRRITSFIDRTYYEKELSAPGETGRVLLGEDFRYTTKQTFTLSMPGIVEGSKAALMVQFMVFQLQRDTRPMTATINNQEVLSISFPTLSTEGYSIGRLYSNSALFATTGDNVAVTLSYPGGTTAKLANLDFITINYHRQLALNDNKSLAFRSYSSQCVDSLFCVKAMAEGYHIWDVTSASKPKAVDYRLTDNTATFRQTESGVREYVAFNPDATFPRPGFDSNVANQNIHAMEAPTMLIITPSEYRSEAERLADIHRTEDGLKVAVLTDQEVYNEFSSGTPDAMAYRKINKMWYDRTSSLPEYSNDRYRYFLLFGRALFDNRRISSATKNIHYPTLLTWESYDCNDDSRSLNTDDVFGFLNDGSDINTNTVRTMNIGIGRLPVTSTSEASQIVDKISDYIKKTDMGEWKSRIMVIADDGDNAIHMTDSELSIDSLRHYGGGNYNIKRLYLDAFQATSNGAGHTYPQAREQMLQTFKNGVIYASYLGHANPMSWTHNELLRWPDIENEFYYKHPPLLFTGTCEFTRWDSATVSGGEVLLMNPRGGTIATITSSRVTIISGNGSLCRNLAKHVFQPLDNGEMPRLGDIIKGAKNDFWYTHEASRNSAGTVVNITQTNIDHSLKYSLLGDPALRLKYPKYEVRLTSVNGKAVDAAPLPETKARQEVEMEGKIVDADGKDVTDYEGTLTATIYDAEVSVTTNGNNESGEPDDANRITYQEHSNRLYVGSGTVSNGQFALKFHMPTGIINNYTPALASLYARSDSHGDALGQSEGFYVYGYDDSVVGDDQAPEITLLALNTSSFNNGDTVNEKPYLIASFHDDSGINLSDLDLGHGLSYVLDDKTIISGLVDYYSQDSDGVGHIFCEMDPLSEGNHTLTLRVWDIFGNLGERTINFKVDKAIAPQLLRAWTTANPAKTKADFYVEHNRPDAMLTVTVSVYDMMGHAVWTATSTGRSDMYKSSPVTWNLQDGSGMRVARGIYIYRVTVRDDNGGEATINQRIAVASE